VPHVIGIQARVADAALQSRSLSHARHVGAHSAFQTSAPSVAQAGPTSVHCSIMHKSLLPTLILLLPAIFAPLSFALPIAAESHLALTDRRCDDSAWASWKAEHGKAYPSLQEDEERCVVFM
jgi:hypothetical protein